MGYTYTESTYIPRTGNNSRQTGLHWLYLQTSSLSDYDISFTVPLISHIHCDTNKRETEDCLKGENKANTMNMCIIYKWQSNMPSDSLYLIMD